MGLNLNSVDINLNNTELIKTFVNSLDEEKNSFRYFNNRDLTVVSNHVYTCILFSDDKPVSYGHLDKEGDRVWLGIVVKKEFQGKGVSKKMMNLLVNKARVLNLNSIYLSVDLDNEKAIALYTKYGFKVVSKNKKNYILNKKIVTIGVSTLAFGRIAKEKVEEIANENNWLIEFSSSFPYDEDMISFFKKIKTPRLVHNYFPAPKIPFVMNLGSTNEEIRQRSIKHCIQGLELSRISGASYYSAHAGFCIDPNPEQLGEPLDVNVSINRDLNWELFLSAIKVVLLEAERLNVSFLIENNVTAKFNLRHDGQEVLLCSRPEELVKLANQIKSNKFGLLLDTAHLKVSSKALNFNLESAVQEITPYVKYVHHSDNDGNKDTNDSIGDDYWFLPFVKDFQESIHIIEVKNIDNNIIDKQINLLGGYK